jgi:hypothetical protein
VSDRARVHAFDEVINFGVVCVTTVVVYVQISIYRVSKITF